LHLLELSDHGLSVLFVCFEALHFVNKVAVSLQSQYFLDFCNLTDRFLDAFACFLHQSFPDLAGGGLKFLANQSQFHFHHFLKFAERFLALLLLGLYFTGQAAKVPFQGEGAFDPVMHLLLRVLGGFVDQSLVKVLDYFLHLLKLSEHELALRFEGGGHWHHFFVQILQVSVARCLLEPDCHFAHFVEDFFFQFVR